MENIDHMSVESERIRLRLIQEADLTEAFMEWFNDKELMRYYTSSKQKITRESLIKSIEEGRANESTFTFAIIHKQTALCIGTIKIGPINKVHKISDLATLIGNKSFQGQGLAAEAIKLGNKIAFDFFDLRKLFSGMYEKNQSSINAYLKAGWLIEGRLKGHYLEDNAPLDRVLVGCFNPKYFSES